MWLCGYVITATLFLFLFMLQHSYTFGCKDPRSGSPESPPDGLWKLQMVRVWWWIPAETRQLRGSGWYWAYGNALRKKNLIINALHVFIIFFPLPLPSFQTQPLDLESCSLCIHIFALNEEGPSTLVLEEDEELTAANHWLLPAGDAQHCGREHVFLNIMLRKLRNLCLLVIIPTMTYL